MNKDITDIVNYLKKESISTNRIRSVLSYLKVGNIPKEWKDFVFFKMNTVIEFLEDLS